STSRPGRPRRSAPELRSSTRVVTSGPLGLRLEDACLVREHDRLDAVAEFELLEDMRDVRLDGGVADVELAPDLRVREARSDEAEDLPLARGELVEALRGR